MSDLGNKEIMAANIKKYMAIKGIDRQTLCNRLGFKYSTVTDWLNAQKYPRIDKIEMMANYFGISKADLVESNPSNTTRAKRGVRIPVLGTIVAGIPLDAVEEVIDWEEIPLAMAAQGEYFALRVKGHSMEPKFLEGDTVIVKKEHDVESGRVAVVLVNGGEATLKKVMKSTDGVTLIGYNALVYEPHFYSNADIENIPVTILGEVVELRRKV